MVARKTDIRVLNSSRAKTKMIGPLRNTHPQVEIVIVVRDHLEVEYTDGRHGQTIRSRLNIREK